MELLIDSSLWVDYFRARTPDPIRRQVTGWIERPEAVAAIPVIYEIRRRCRRDEREYVDSTLSTVSLLALPGDLWERRPFCWAVLAPTAASPRALSTS